MDYLHTTEAELGINLDIPLSEHDPLDKLNDLANKKRKHDDDIHDYFKANKRLKSSVQYEDHLPGIVLNEPVLSMIMFNFYHRLDFVTIEDLKDFLNTMLYTVQEIFFRRHQGPGLDDHARTFSSLLLAKVDKRNLNPLKKMRVNERGRLLGSVLEPFSISVDLNLNPLSVTQAEVFQFESLKFLQRQLFRSLEDWELSSLQFMQRYKN
ncbi:hypothetical protein Tco_1114516 [Tanacetum coccineum]|uniref:Uncharacterized protein n=1 Tax=Tanacetum coccineum TaxID=301880 RepID=A0ABQ5IVC0_9ASTR